MEVFITPPIPTRRGLVVTEPDREVIVESQAGPLRWEPVKTGRSNASGEFYFPAKADSQYLIISEGEERIAWSNKRRIFNDNFTDLEYSKAMWQTRGTTYLKGKSDYAKADPQCATWEDGKLVLRVMEGEQEGRFITGHVATGEIGEPARFAFTHGWAAAKVKFHPLRGALSGFWAQFLDGRYHELDIAEYGGTKNLHGKNGNVWHTVYHTPAIGAKPEKAGQFNTGADDVGKDFDTDRVVFSCNWQPDFFDFWVNTRRVGRITQGLSSNPKFLVASILVRNYDLDNLLANLGQIKTFADEYDWIRVWK